MFKASPVSVVCGSQAALVQRGGRGVEAVLSLQLPLFLYLLGLWLTVGLLSAYIVGHSIDGDDFCRGGGAA